MQNYNNIEANEYDLFQYFQILMTTANKVQSFENLSAETIIPSALFLLINNFDWSSIHLNKECLSQLLNRQCVSQQHNENLSTSL